jgi:hypothetical protein
MIAAKAVMDSLLERACYVASLAVLSRYSDITVQADEPRHLRSGLLEDVQTAADIPDGRMPSPLPFGRDVGVLRSVVLDKHRRII